MKIRELLMRVFGVDRAAESRRPLSGLPDSPDGLRGLVSTGHHDPSPIRDLMNEKLKEREP